VKSTHPVGQLWTIKYHMLHAAMCASTTSTAGRKRHALNDQNGLAVTAVAVILSLNPGVAGSHFTSFCSCDLNVKFKFKNDAGEC